MSSGLREGGWQGGPVRHSEAAGLVVAGRGLAAPDPGEIVAALGHVEEARGLLGRGQVEPAVRQADRRPAGLALGRRDQRGGCRGKRRRAAGTSRCLQSAVQAEASVPLRGAFTNEADSADRLLAVSTPAATSVEVLTGGITLPAQTQVDAVNGAPQLRLEGVRSPIDITQLVPVTFTFSTAGSVTLGVPVATRSGTTATPRERPTR